MSCCSAGIVLKMSSSVDLLAADYKAKSDSPVQVSRSPGLIDVRSVIDLNLLALPSQPLLH
jgi:hypothetical protein